MSVIIRKFDFNLSRVGTIIRAKSIAQATKMGLLDGMVDWFRGGVKREAIEQLFNELCNGKEEGASPDIIAERFCRFRDLVKNEYKSQFAMTVEKNENSWSLKLAIGSCLITELTGLPYNDDMYGKVDKTKSAFDKEFNERCDKLKSEIIFDEKRSSLKNKKITVELQTQNLKNSDFSSGGVNKRFHKGVLKAINKTGQDDFIKEDGLAVYINSKSNKNELCGYVSLQKSIETPKQLNPAFGYASVDLYDCDIKTTELDNYFNELKSKDKEELKIIIPSLVLQVIDMQRCLYKADIQHRDLHMHNLLIHIVDDTPIVKAIDFGKATFGQNIPSQFADINYLFAKEALTPFETINRNLLRSETSEKQAKHYPLHKLIALLKPHDPAGVQNYLLEVSDKLKIDLNGATDENQIDDAFYRCMLKLKDYLADDKGLYGPVALAR